MTPGENEPPHAIVSGAGSRVREGDGRARSTPRSRYSFAMVTYGPEIFGIPALVLVVVVVGALVWLLVAIIRALNAYTAGQRARTALFLERAGDGDSIPDVD